MIWVLLFLLVIVVAAIFFVFGSYNGLVRARNRIEEAYAQIDVQLKKRYDLIPNLVETVKGYATHEKETLDAVISARNAGINATGPIEQAEAENQISGALKSLFSITEAYPDLKANQNYLHLQETLTGVEDKIAYSRQYYNDSVNKYNTRTETFPGVLIAGAFNFNKREYFEAEGAARGPVQVKFD